jgi:4-hydroxybenzoate polyprenyltransferase/phosphoserine phosphatase
MQPSDHNSIPLCVDLDGTLVKLDTLHQALFMLIRSAPSVLFQLPSWIKKGRAHTKNEVASRMPLRASDLPYNQALLAYLREEKKRGRKIILVTAANERTAYAVADHVALFDEVIASSATTNLFGEAKAAKLREKYDAYDYAGDSIHDLPVWKAAHKKILVNPDRKAKRQQPADLLIEEKRGLFPTLSHALRLHQWPKNLLVFTPLVLAHQLHQPTLLWHGFLAFFSFSAMASAIYLINDLLDIAADQNHPRKKSRPLAAGDLSLLNGFRLFPIMLIVGLSLSLWLPLNFQLSILLYLLVTLLYSFKLKQFAILDLFILTLLYTLRIFAGGAATHTPISGWFISFSLLFFFTLALSKRASELWNMNRLSVSDVDRGRGYSSQHLCSLEWTGYGSSLLSLLILAGYIVSDKAQNLYTEARLMWLIPPILCYWLIRVWRAVRNGTLKEDPLLYTLCDKQTYGLGLLTGLILYYSI